MNIVVIPDTQAKPGNDFTFMRRIGNYIVAKQPDVIVHLGDLADMESLSSYDRGTKNFEGRRYRSDIEAAHAAQDALFAPINEYNKKAKSNHEKRYIPQKIMLLGNHDHRINKVINEDAKLDGTISIADLKYEEYGWEVHPFLQPVVVNGVAFCHYFTSGVMGRPCTSASLQLQKKHMSCISGHQQGFQIHTEYNAAGKRLTSIIAGSCYEHQEDYMGPQGNNHWRGIMMLFNVDQGEFDMVPVPLSYLARKYDF